MKIPPAGDDAGFIHLHVHSNYSLLRGADPIERLGEQAARHGFPAVALTDRNGLYGAVAFQQACEKQGIKPIFGAQLVTPATSCVALVINHMGYRNLCRIITALHQPPADRPFDLAACLMYYREGLVLFSRDQNLLAYLQQTTGSENLFVEVYPDSIARSWRIHRQIGLPLLATNNVWFCMPADYQRHRLLTAIGLNTSLSAIPGNALADREHWLKPPSSMNRAFRDLPEAVANTVCVAAKCNFRLKLGELHLPQFPFTDGKSSSDILRAKTEAGITRRYGAATPEVRAQVERELKIIREMGYADYFLIVADIVDAAKEMGVPTCGRGSAANSVV
ncbi:PHP domain-containing protein, partial [Candidatus Zixiibacteriota bacterium]